MKAQFDRNWWKSGAILFATLLLLLIGFPRTSQAQMQTTTGINGTVTDSSGAVVAHADVTVREQTTGSEFHAHTNDAGIYSFPSLLPGDYTITVRMDGFNTAVVTDRRILATQPAVVDVQLKVGQATQQVTVSASGAELLSTDSQDITGTVTPALVREIPTARGNFFDLLTLTPGVNMGQGSGYNGGLQTSFISTAFNYVSVANTINQAGAFVGGNRDSASNVSVDGANVQDPVYQQTPQLQPEDSIQELRVETANMSAEFGYGASGINVITKSGSNKFHGDLFEYLRNNAFDSNLFFSNQAHQTLAPYQQNLFGGSVGGPIKKDKLLFFFDYQGLRANTHTNVQITAPPTSYVQGNFSVNADLSPTTGQPLPAVPIYNPYQYNATTGQRAAFAGNIIPLGSSALCAPKPTCADPVALAFDKSWLLTPNAVVAGVPEYLGVAPSNLTSNDYNARVDFLHSAKTTIYGRYTQTPESGITSSPDPLVGTTNNESSYNAVLHWIQTLSPSMVNHAYIAFDHPVWVYARKTAGVPDVSKAIGITGTSQYTGGPDFTGTGFDMDTSGTFIDNGHTNTYQLNDDLNWIHGRHNIKFGVSLLDKRFQYPTQADDKGVFYFNGQYTAQCAPGDTNFGCTGLTTSTSGLGFSDYLMGATDENFLKLNGAPYAGYQLYKGFYIEDSWRVTSKLTLNFGLRYENWSPWLDPRNTTLTYNPANGNPVYALQNPLDYLSSSKCYGACAPLNPAAVNRSSYKTGNLNFAPRFGLAYEISPRTVFRASFGVYFDGNLNNNQLSNLQSGAAPFQLSYTQNILPDLVDTPVPTYTVATQFGAISPTSIPVPNGNPVNTYRFVVPYLPTPAVNQWSGEVEQRIGNAWGLSVSYLGSHTSHEFMFTDENAAVLPAPGTALVNETLQQRRVFPAWGQLGTWAPQGYAEYNALIASFHNANPWHGLTLISNFQWAKNITSSYWGYSDEGNENFRSPYIWAGDYTADPPTKLVMGYSYHLPFGAGHSFGSSSNSVVRQLVSGWMASGINTFSHGGWAPVWDLGPDQTGTGLNNMPNRTCNPNNVPGGHTYLEWFNRACFSEAAYGTWGNSNIAAYTEPGINNWNLALAKDTKTGFPRESGLFQFRVDMFNAFNHVQWASPTNYVSNWAPSNQINVGRISSTYPARQIQFTLRYLF